MEGKKNKLNKNLVFLQAATKQDQAPVITILTVKQFKPKETSLIAKQFSNSLAHLIPHLASKKHWSSPTWRTHWIMANTTKKKSNHLSQIVLHLSAVDSELKYLITGINCG